MIDNAIASVYLSISTPNWATFNHDLLHVHESWA